MCFWHRSEYVQSAGLLYIDSNDFTGIVKTNTVVVVLMVTFDQVRSPFASTCANLLQSFLHHLPCARGTASSCDPQAEFNLHYANVIIYLVRSTI